MSTLAPPPVPVKPSPAPVARKKPVRAAPAPDVCRLTVTIRGADYRARPVRNETSAGRAWSLRKVATGARYHVVETPHGPSCDCADFTFKRDGIDPAGCKHVRSLRAT